MNKKLRWTNASLAKALLDDLIQIKIALAKVWVIAKGVLLMGPADAGKTLLAQVGGGAVRTICSTRFAGRRT